MFLHMYVYRFCLWILGNGATLLNSGSIWEKLVLDAKRRGCFYNAYDNMSLALAISNALIELGHLNSLFDMNSVLFITSKWKVLAITPSVGTSAATNLELDYKPFVRPRFNSALDSKIP